MSGLGWQDLVAAALVATALWYLVRRRRVRPKPPIVQLGRAPKRGPGAPPT